MDVSAAIANLLISNKDIEKRGLSEEEYRNEDNRKNAKVTWIGESNKMF